MEHKLWVQGEVVGEPERVRVIFVVVTKLLALKVKSG